MIAHAAVAAKDIKSIDLFDAMDEQWFKYPFDVMRNAGQATQTFAALLSISNRETFVPVSTIAERARLPLNTTRRHLDVLVGQGWVTNDGRQRTKRGGPRRTCTRKFTEKAKRAIEQYAVLPWWAMCPIRRVGKLPWGTRAVLSVVMGRLMTLKGAINKADGAGCLDSSDYWGGLGEMGDAERFRFTNGELAEITGLQRQAIIAARWQLYNIGLVDCRYIRDDDDDRSNNGYTLCPCEPFRIVTTSLGNNRCYIDFESAVWPPR